MIGEAQSDGEQEVTAPVGMGARPAGDQIAHEEEREADDVGAERRRRE